MKFLSKKLCAFAFACGLALCASQTSAAGEMGCPMWGNSYGPQMTPQQLETAQEIIGRGYANMDSTRQALAAKRNELDSILASPNPDSGRIEQLSREIGELRGKMLSARAQVRSELIQNGLSPDFLGPNGLGREDNYAPPRGYHHGHYHGWRGHRGGHGCMMGCW